MTVKPLPQKPGSREIWKGFKGSSHSLAIAQLAQAAKTPLIVVTKDTPTAIRLEKEINFFCQHELSDSGNHIATEIFPDWEILPYDNFSPHQDIISQRIKTLFRLQDAKQGVVIIPITTLLSRIAPKQFINQNTFLINVGDTLDRDHLRERLIDSGYRFVNEVLEHGEFCIRGSIIDLFPTGSSMPFRIDLFDDEVDTIREFDPETQRSENKRKSIQLLPGREFPVDSQAISHFRKEWRNLFDSAINCPIYEQVSEGVLPAGIEYYLPLFFDETATIFDFISKQSCFVTVDNIEQSGDSFWHELEVRYEERRHDRLRPILSPNSLFLKVDELFGLLKQHPRVHFDLSDQYNKHHVSFESQSIPEVVVDHKKERPLQLLEDFVNSFTGKVVICAETAGRRESLIELFNRHQIKPTTVDSVLRLPKTNDKLLLCVAPIDEGFILEADANKTSKSSVAIALITESQLLGQRVLQERRRKKEIKHHHEDVVRNLAELQIGEPIVHVDMGVGRYAGLQTLSAGNQQSEYVVITYADDDKLYVPVQSLHLIARYSAGMADGAPLHKLGSEQWSKAKKKAAERARDVAAELLDIYARRESKPGFVCQFEKSDYEKFAASFPFEETPDQETAIQAVLDDLRSDKVMDRLVCGDVGFGKTEVAMRAAFATVTGGSQVAILAPTTLLAQQHYETLRDRFADWPFRIEVLSRFTQSKAQTQTKADLAEGKVDIVVGTHKLLQPTIKYKHLGLVIIDEEHRFGVRQKDQLKSMRSDVNILTLTATPIPRTLNMSLSGMRDLSIITTPPAKRLAIKTFVREKNNALIREAIMREIMRGGQVYYLHNEVDSIAKAAEVLGTLVPEARIGIGHGQMRERELERVMQDFYHQRFNVLVCTTIIETGIDVPTANTIIMDRADKLGLAQMHQLRGRVGRSHHQAYAYLITPNEKLMSKDALKRLEAIESAETLGAGFTLATHDMEIRGAGELLGDEQSGHIQTIGFTLFMDLLDRAVKAIKQGKQPDFSLTDSHGCEIDLRIPALLPEDYIPDVNMRLSLYKRIASIQSAEQLDDIQVELIDRFGLLPDAAKSLFTQAQLKLAATPLGIRKIDVGVATGRLEFADDTCIDPGSLITMIQREPDKFRLDGPRHLKFMDTMEDDAARLTSTQRLIQKLSAMTAASNTPPANAARR